MPNYVNRLFILIKNYKKWHALVKINKKPHNLLNKYKNQLLKKAFPQGLFKKQPQGNELLYDVRFNHIFQSI